MKDIPGWKVSQFVCLLGSRTNCFLDWRERVFERQVPDEGDCSEVEA